MTTNRKISPENTPFDPSLISELNNSFSTLIELDELVNKEQKMDELTQEFEKKCADVEQRCKELLFRYQIYKQKGNHLYEDLLLFRKQMHHYQHQNPIKVFLLELLGLINREEERVKLNQQRSELFVRREEWKKDCTELEEEKSELSQRSDQLEKLKIELKKKVEMLEEYRKNNVLKEATDGQKNNDLSPVVARQFASVSPTGSPRLFAQGEKSEKITNQTPENRTNFKP